MGHPSDTFITFSQFHQCQDIPVEQEPVVKLSLKCSKRFKTSCSYKLKETNTYQKRSGCSLQENISLPDSYRRAVSSGKSPFLKICQVSALTAQVSPPCLDSSQRHSMSFVSKRYFLPLAVYSTVTRKHQKPLLILKQSCFHEPRITISGAR